MKRYQTDGSTDSGSGAPLGGVAWGSLGVLMAGAFYLVVKLTAWPPLERYFLGHPVAVAATLLFSIGAAILLGKFCQTTVQWSMLTSLRDEDLMLSRDSKTTAERWLETHDAGHVARQWLTQIRELPLRTRSSVLVRRLEESEPVNGLEALEDTILREYVPRDDRDSLTDHPVVGVLIPDDVHLVDEGR